MPNSSREPRVSGQRPALWLALLSVIGVIGFLWFVGEKPEALHGKKASHATGSIAAVSERKDGQRERSPQNPESQAELEKAVTEKTRELIAKYRPLRAEYERLQQGTRHLRATILEARKVGTARINDAGKLFNETWRPYFAQNAQATEKLRFQCERLLSAEVLLESLKSTAPTGDTNFGALMQDLLANTDYPERLETYLEQLAKEDGFNPPMLRKEDGNRTLSEMIEELQKVTPVLEEHRKKILAAQLPPEMHEYMTAQSKAFALSSLIVQYDDSWNGKAKKLQEKFLEIALHIQRELSRLPMTNDTRTRLASEYQAAVFDLKTPHDSTEGKSPGVAR